MIIWRIILDLKEDFKLFVPLLIIFIFLNTGVVKLYIRDILNNWPLVSKRDTKTVIEKRTTIVEIKIIPNDFFPLSDLNHQSYQSDN